MKRRCGFMLVNMLIVIALMGAFAVVADRVFRLSLQTSAKVAREQEESIRLEQAINTLRADVWGARNVEANGTSGLRITDAGGHVPVAVIEPAHRFFDLVDAMIGDLYSNSHRG